MSERFNVYTILTEWEKSTFYIDHLLESSELTRFGYRLVKGVIEKKILLDHAMSPYMKRLPSEAVQMVLRIAAYELLFNDSSKEYAAVNEAVELTAMVEPPAKGFVNAVLRSFLRAGKKISYPTDPASSMCIRYSYPRWIVDLFLKQYTPQQTEALFSFYETAGYTDLRINETKISPEGFTALLDEQSISYERSSDMSFTVRLPDPIDVKTLPGFADGYFYVQDTAAQLLCMLFSPIQGPLLDVGSAPGGKVTFFAEHNPGNFLITALESSTRRIKKLSQNITRLGLTGIDIVQSDFLKYNPSWNYRHIFLDVPCSGLGVLHAKVDIKYRLTPEDLTSLRKVQVAMLDHSARLLAPDGEIIYSTCTVNREENESVIEDFLRSHSDFKPVRLSEKNHLRTDACNGIVLGETIFRSYPPQHKMAGMFGVMLTR